MEGREKSSGLLSLVAAHSLRSGQAPRLARDRLSLLIAEFILSEANGHERAPRNDGVDAFLFLVIAREAK